MKSLDSVVCGTFSVRGMCCVGYVRTYIYIYIYICIWDEMSDLQIQSIDLHYAFRIEEHQAKDQTTTIFSVSGIPQDHNSRN